MFDIHRSIRDEDGVHDEDAWEAYRDELLDEFAESPEAKLIIDQGVRLQWTWMYLDYAMTHLGSTPIEITAADQNKLLFDIIPRKVMVEAEYAGEIVAELRAFWQFMDRQYQVPTTRKLAAELDDAAVEDLRAELADDGNFGMAKSLFSLAKQQGFDITDEADLQRFMLAYNARLAESRMPPPFLYPPPSPEPLGGFLPLGFDRKAKRKKSKAQRQAKKRNRR